MDKLNQQKQQNRRQSQKRREESAFKEESASAKSKAWGRFFARHASMLRIAVIGVVALYATIVIVSHVVTLREKKEEQQQLIAAEAALEQEVEGLENDAGYVGSKEYIEQKAREALGWVKDNEILFRKAGE